MFTPVDHAETLSGGFIIGKFELVNEHACGVVKELYGLVGEEDEHVGSAEVVKHYQVLDAELKAGHLNLSLPITILVLLFIHSLYILLSQQFQLFIIPQPTGTLSLDQILNQHLPIEAFLLHQSQELAKIDMRTVFCLLKLILEVFPFCLRHSAVFP